MKNMDPDGACAPCDHKNIRRNPADDRVKVSYMRVSDQFILRTIADENLLIPVGDAAIHVKGLIALSESGVLLYNRLKDGCSREELIAALTGEYDVSDNEAAEDTDAFLNQLRELNMLLED